MCAYTSVPIHVCVCVYVCDWCWASKFPLASPCNWTASRGLRANQSRAWSVLMCFTYFWIWQTVSVCMCYCPVHVVKKPRRLHVGVLSECACGFVWVRKAHVWPQGWKVKCQAGFVHLSPSALTKDYNNLFWGSVSLFRSPSGCQQGYRYFFALVFFLTLFCPFPLKFSSSFSFCLSYSLPQMPTQTHTCSVPLCWARGNVEGGGKRGESVFGRIRYGGLVIRILTPQIRD